MSLTLRAALRMIAAAQLAGCATSPLVQRLPAGVSADTVREQTLSRGVSHRYVWSATGPWAMHIVEVQPRACGIELRTMKGNDSLSGRETTSSLAARAAAAAGRPVLAAVNADFFSSDPPGIPLGPQVLRGEVVKGQGPHPEMVERTIVPGTDVFGVTDSGSPFIATVQLTGELRMGSGAAMVLGAVNARPEAGRWSLYSPLRGPSTPADTGAVEIVVRRLETPTAAGKEERGVVVGVDTAAGGVPIPPDGVVLAARQVAGARSLSPGDTLRWSLTFRGAPGPVTEMVGGFPHLLAADTSLLPGNDRLRPSFSNTRHPRTAVGIRPDGSVLLVTVDGRQPGYSEGMTLPELVDLMHALGTPRALNLDGGGSTSMVIQGALVNRSSDQAGERPVSNALLLLGPRPGFCR